MTKSISFIETFAKHYASGKDTKAALKATDIEGENHTTEAARIAARSVKGKTTQGVMHAAVKPPYRAIHYLVILIAASAVIDYIYLGSFILSSSIIFLLFSLMGTSCGLSRDLGSLKLDAAPEKEEHTDFISNEPRFLACQTLIDQIDLMDELLTELNADDPNYEARKAQYTAKQDQCCIRYLQQSPLQKEATPEVQATSA